MVVCLELADIRGQPFSTWVCEQIRDLQAELDAMYPPAIPQPETARKPARIPIQRKHRPRVDPRVDCEPKRKPGAAQELDEWGQPLPGKVPAQRSLFFRVR